MTDTNSKSYLEKMSNQKLKEKLKIDNIDLDLVSSGYSVGNTAIININGKNYSKNRRGLNIVVLNKKTGEILDSISCDTYGDPNLKIQR